MFSFQQNGYLDLYGDYFGQQEPGTNVSVFAQGIISGNPLHGTPVFSPDMSELYWPQAEPDFSNTNIYVSKKINDQWTVPEVTSFSGAYHDDNSVFSPDGQKIFFNSMRIHNGSSKERIWYVTRQVDGTWSEAFSVGDEINEEELHWQVGVDLNGGIYFQSGRQPSFGGGDLFFSDFVNQQLQTPVNMGSTINTSEYDSMPFIDQHNRFMIFCRDDGIYLAERLYGGSWAEPQRITSINPNIKGICPQITPDGNYLFFAIMNNTVSTVYWTSAQFINDLVTDVDGSVSELPDAIKLYQNYPNPFNPSTTIKYLIPEESKVMLEVFNILGNRIITLVDELKPPGNYEVKFDASSLSSGMYFYRLQSSTGVSVTKKLVLQK